MITEPKRDPQAEHRPAMVSALAHAKTAIADIEGIRPTPEAPDLVGYPELLDSLDCAVRTLTRAIEGLP